MDLRTLLEVMPVLASDGALERPIAGLAYDSRQVEPNFLFVAVRGFHVDGHDYISQALARGAAAVIYDNQEWRTPDGHTVGDLCSRAGAAAIRVADSRVALSPLAAALNDYPARSIQVVGVTGTKGKTTTSTLIAALLDGGGHRSGLITTVDFKIGERWWPNETRQTTPEAPEIQSMLRRMVDEGCDYAVVESSSHALSPRWNRLGDCEYDVAVFTNVTHEHLDYHGTFEQYRSDKGQLFKLLAASVAEKTVRGETIRPRKAAIVNRDDPNADFFIERAGQTQVITYGVDSSDADVQARDIQATQQGLQFTAKTPWGTTTIEVPIVGIFNLPNLLAALCVGLSQGMSLAECREALRRVPPVSGRMERIDLGQPFSVLVDYAHNPDSFEKLMSTARLLTQGRMIAVFGSAGERDRQKRPIQGAIAARYCDFIVLADEDPRLEDPLLIIDEIAAGVEQEGKREGEHYRKIPDRREAIRAALGAAQPGDIVMLLGKGHESCIIYADHKLPWDEREVARELLREMGFGA